MSVAYATAYDHRKTRTRGIAAQETRCVRLGAWADRLHLGQGAADAQAGVFAGLQKTILPQDRDQNQNHQPNVGKPVMKETENYSCSLRTEDGQPNVSQLTQE